MRIYDNINNFTYAEGRTKTELVNSWNKTRKDNLFWIMENDQTNEYGSVDAYKRLTKRVKYFRELPQILFELNKIDGNNIQIYEDWKEILKKSWKKWKLKTQTITKKKGTFF